MYIQRLVHPDDLSVVFQPIVHMSSLELFAYEALVRCRVPELTNPQKLFERAVTDNCVGRLGRMVREVALPLCEGLPVFLNIHPAELEERWVVRPDDPMYFHDREVYVEITESVPLSHFALCRDVLNEVRSRGNLYLVVDDLGAGYSNLKRIADLEPRIVKLDRDLIAGVEIDSRQQRLVSQIVSLCQSLGADVVAEGIETTGEFEALRDTGVHYGQGFLFARPSYPHPAIEIPPRFKAAPAPRTPPRGASMYPSVTPTHAMESVAPPRALSSKPQ
jgi:EAL domain-containing protein (putative c-di-GMP-specific phosphodiesterase class I)